MDHHSEASYRPFIKKCVHNIPMTEWCCECEDLGKVREDMSKIRDKCTSDGPSQEKDTYEGHATRSSKQERYDLIPSEIYDALARRFGLGAVIHGDQNWMGGGVKFIKATINHLYAHLSAELQGDSSDAHTDAVVWNAGALCWFKKVKPIEYSLALAELRGEKCRDKS